MFKPRYQNRFFFGFYLNQIFTYINKIDSQINFILTTNNNFSNSRIAWKIHRLNWYKNRLFFNTIFTKKHLPKKIFAFLHLNNLLDRNLILIWKKTKFRNLCFFDIEYNLKSGKKEPPCCRISLFSRKLSPGLYVHPKTGCICCAKMHKLTEPIWWDDENKIKTLLTIKKFESEFRLILFANTFIKKKIQKGKDFGHVIKFFLEKIFAMKKNISFKIFCLKYFRLNVELAIRNYNTVKNYHESLLYFFKFYNLQLIERYS